MNKISVVATAVSSLCLCCSFSSFAAQNEITIGFADLNDYGDEFIGIEYKRYLADVQADNDPFLISPYLNKTDSIFARYFGVDGFDRYELGGEFFIDDKWVVNGQLRYGDYSSDYSFRDNYVSVNVDTGYFVTPHWQVGGGLIYEYQDGRVYGDHLSDNQTTASVFGRYTNIAQGKGWDVAMKALVNDTTRIEVDARYFFNRRFSTSLAYLTEISTDEYAFTESDVAELTVDYWFTPGWSLQAGAGVYTGGDESGLAAITLSTSLRF